jgi:hypothetical protein
VALADAIAGERSTVLVAERDGELIGISPPIWI